MSPLVSLVPVTREIFDSVACLEVHEHQRDFLASNAYSIAEASFNDALRPRAILAGSEPVGFVMYVVPEPGDEEPGSYGIWRFMIAGADQGKGYGRAALDVVLREISLHADASKVFISCKPANETAKRLYAAFGFEEIGLEAGTGEMVAVLALNP
nr:GNAT family N-acetyltransferase [uncultured Roseateles sp.]